MFATIISLSLMLGGGSFAPDVQIESDTHTTVEDKKYAVIAQTKGIMDYAVNCRVEATCIGNSCSISYVEVATGSGYTRVSHMTLNGETSFTYQGYTYYFKF